MIINSTNNAVNKNRLLNIELWTNEYICEWLKGVGEKGEIYVNNFQEKQITGRNLIILDDSDLCDIGIQALDHRIVLLNIIRNLVQIKHDLNNETLHSLVFNTKNRVICILNYIDRLYKCVNCNYSISNSGGNNYYYSPCKLCSKTEYEICRLISSLSTSYRRLLSWLARLPFTRLKTIDEFRNEINSEMKNLLKLYRKRYKLDDFYDNLKISLQKVINHCTKFLDTCDTIGEDDYDKNTIVYNYCYLEKVVIRKKDAEQLLGITITNLIDGIYTVAEIGKDSASDECSRLNVGDDIIAINDQVIFGWSNANVYRLLDSIYTSTNSFVLLLRKMPREHTTTLKQQRFINNLTTLPRDQKHHKRSSKDARKHSFADVFLSDQDLLDNTSEDDEEIPMFGHTMHRQAIVDNRRIQSMHNLTINKSRSNSADTLDNIPTPDNVKGKKNKERKKSSDSDSIKTDFQSKSDIIRSFFSSKRFDRWEVGKSKKQNNQSSIEISEPSTPNLLHVKRLDSNDTPTPTGKPPISSKPPIDKKFTKTSKRPIYQTWLYKRKPLNKTTTVSIIPINTSKWQRYYCLLMKDHIVFNKLPEDRTPKDYILLKNFTLQKTAKQCSFKLIDHTKNNAEHEFYTETWEEFRDWFQYLSEIKAKSTPTTSHSDNQSPILMHNRNDSSRESSPLGSPVSKIASRDSSPSMSYPNHTFKAGCYTSESECDTDTASKQQSSPLVNNVHVKYNSQLSLQQPIDVNRERKSSNPLNNLKKASDLTKNTELPASFGIYNNHVQQHQLITNYEQQHRCNSLPGSLQSCVGSYLNEHHSRKPPVAAPGAAKRKEPPMVSPLLPIRTNTAATTSNTVCAQTTPNTPSLPPLPSTPVSSVSQLIHNLSQQQQNSYRTGGIPPPSPVSTPPSSSLLTQYSRSVLNAAASPYVRQSPSQIIYLKKPAHGIASATVSTHDSLPLTPPLTPLAATIGQTMAGGIPTYRTELTILPSTNYATTNSNYKTNTNQ